MAISAVASRDKDIFVSFSLNNKGLLFSGETAVHAVKAILRENETKANGTIRAVLFNCCSPEAADIALRQVHHHQPIQQLLRRQNIRFGVYANRVSTCVPAGWTMSTMDTALPMRQDLSPEKYADIVLKWIRELGVNIVGGCCGMGPEYISELHNRIHTI